MYNKLQYISQGNNPQEQLYNIQTALDNGFGWIQIRFKNGSEKDCYHLAETVKKYAENYKATVIINDNPVIAKNIAADGVHLGLEDMSVSEARQLIGNDKIIGGTANTLQHVLQRHDEKCNYIGLGPFRFTATKQKLSPVLGIAGYQSILESVKELQYTIPIYAIGGITLNDIDLLRETGIYGIAVSEMITRHPDKKQLLTQLNEKLYEHL